MKRPIIGKFEHQVGGYLQLRFDNDTTTVGVTGSHPFWSEDRHTWVKAQHLNIGENLKTQHGTAILTQRQTLETKTTVYNLEVYQDHNYLVSEDRLLVHNSCPKTPKTAGHHSDPQFMGGDPKQDLTHMLEDDHVDLHKDLNAHLENYKDASGNTMRPKKGNSGANIRKNFDRKDLLNSAADFYKSPKGSSYTGAANDFFKHHPSLK